MEHKHECSCDHNHGEVNEFAGANKYQQALDKFEKAPLDEEVAAITAKLIEEHRA